MPLGSEDMSPRLRAANEKLRAVPSSDDVVTTDERAVHAYYADGKIYVTAGGGGAHLNSFAEAGDLMLELVGAMQDLQKEGSVT